MPGASGCRSWPSPGGPRIGYDPLNRISSVRADLPVRGRTQTGALAIDATINYVSDEAPRATRLR